MILMLLASVALAQNLPSGPSPDEVAEDPATLRQKTPAEYGADLDGEDGPDRSYAARELKRLAHDARRRASGKPGTERTLEGRIALADLHDDVWGPALDAVVRRRDVRGAVASVLECLGDPDALPALREALAAEDRAGVQKRLQKAITALEAP
jgi:HEAT repeat protein